MWAQISHRNRKPAMPDKCACLRARARALEVKPGRTSRWMGQSVGDITTRDRPERGNWRAFLKNPRAEQIWDRMSIRKISNIPIHRPRTFYMKYALRAANRIRWKSLAWFMIFRIGSDIVKISPRFYKFLSCIHFNHFKSFRRYSVIFFTKSVA